MHFAGVKNVTQCAQFVLVWHSVADFTSKGSWELGL